MHHSAARLGNFMVVYGGYCGEKKEVLADCYAFDLATYTYLGPARSLPRRWLFCY